MSNDVLKFSTQHSVPLWSSRYELARSQTATDLRPTPKWFDNLNPPHMNLSPRMNSPRSGRVRVGLPVLLTAVFAGIAVANMDGIFPVAAIAVAMTMLIAFCVGSLDASNMSNSSSVARENGILTPARLLLYAALLLSSATIFRPAAGLTATDWLFASAGLLAVLHALTDREGRSDRSTQILITGTALFVFGGVLSSVEVSSFGASMLVLVRVAIVAVGLTWITSKVLTSPAELKRAVQCWTASAALCGFAAVLAASTGFLFPDALNSYGRYSGLAVHFNEMGAICALTIVPAVYLSTDQRSSARTRLGSVVVLAGVVAGILLSGSVNAMLTSIIAVAAYVLLAKVRLQALISLSLIPVVTLLVAATLVPSGTQTPLKRLNLAGASTDTPGGTVASRVETFRLAQERIEENPLIGVGFADRLTENGYEIHNILLEVWHGGGVFALLGIVLILIGFGHQGWRLYILANRDSIDPYLASALIAAFVAFVTYAMAAILLYKRIAWIAPALMAAAYSVQLRKVYDTSPKRSDLVPNHDIQTKSQPA